MCARGWPWPESTWRGMCQLSRQTPRPAAPQSSVRDHSVPQPPPPFARPGAPSQEAAPPIRQAGHGDRHRRIMRRPDSSGVLAPNLGTLVFSRVFLGCVWGWAPNPVGSLGRGSSLTSGGGVEPLGADRGVGGCLERGSLVIEACESAAEMNEMKTAPQQHGDHIRSD